MGIFSRKQQVTDDIPTLTEDEKWKVREIMQAMIKHIEHEITGKTITELEQHRKTIIQNIMAVNGDLLIIPRDKTPEEEEQEKQLKQEKGEDFELETPMATEEDFQKLTTQELVETYQDTIKMMEKII